MGILAYFVFGFLAAGYLVKPKDKDAMFTALVVAFLWPVVGLLGIGSWLRKKVDAF